MQWSSAAPTKCQVCQHKFKPPGVFVDAVVEKNGHRTWALVCERCHELYGFGLGLGCGQKYDLVTLTKIAG